MASSSLIHAPSSDFKSIRLRNASGPMSGHRLQTSYVVVSFCA
jgi:hypothetical protein